MGQQEITDILKKVYPRYLSAQEVFEQLTYSKTTVLKCLSRLAKRNEVEFVIKKADSKFAIWQKHYRIKEENNDRKR